MLTFHDDERDLDVDVDDDGEKAYAYLRAGGKTRSAVWLYNNGPVTLPLKLVEGEPPQNHPSFVKDEPFEPVEEDDVNVTFGGESEESWGAGIFLRKRLHAYLNTTSKTGWCVLAKKDGPVAKCMSVEEQPDQSWTFNLLQQE